MQVKRKASDGTLTTKEERSKGSVNQAVYLTYLRAWGPSFTVPIIFLAIALLERGFQVRSAPYTALVRLALMGHEETHLYNNCSFLPSQKKFETDAKLLALMGHEKCARCCR